MVTSIIEHFSRLRDVSIKLGRYWCWRGEHSQAGQAENIKILEGNMKSGSVDLQCMKIMH